jgi:N-dimethylarginine dimethylaminohydrolase
MTTPIYLMSPPRADWALRGKANFKSIAAGEADAAAAIREWQQLADAIVEAGGEVLVCPPSMTDNLTGLIYTAEAGEFYRDDAGRPGFILPNMAVAHRKAEADHIERFIAERLRWQTERIEPVWEAQGDAIRGLSADDIVHTYGVGPYARTSAEAYAEVAPKLSARHLQIRFHADPWFHGNTFLQVFRGSQKSIVLVCPEALAQGELARLQGFFPETEVVPISAAQSQGYDTNALQVNDTVLAPATFSDTAREAVESIGLTVRCLDLGELFLKGGGAPVCLTNRLWGLSLDEVDPSLLWRSGQGG